MDSKKKSLIILGIRGVPARHGGFETFAERLSQYLSQKDWNVTVFCQEYGRGRIWMSDWMGIRRIHIPIIIPGSLGSLVFDIISICRSIRMDGLCLTLGYNSAIFNFYQKIFGKINLINMDGIEWRRDKWGLFTKAWFWFNEHAGCWIGNHLVADHPRIKDHLATRVRSEKITMIPYGGDEVLSADAGLLSAYGISPGAFSVIIARPEPENSFLEMVRAFSAKPRAHKLVVLGNFDDQRNPYHRKVIDSASNEVIFPGAIYDSSVVQALRYYCRFYLHGHRVGGTNPSLVEAMGAGCAIIAQDNQFNRWVAGDGAAYFKDEAACSILLDNLLTDDSAVSHMKTASRARFYKYFTWERILVDYENLLSVLHPKK